MKLYIFLACLALFQVGVQSKKGKGRSRSKSPSYSKSTSVQSALNTLRENVSALWSEVNEFESSRVAVHVHGMGHDDADTHHDTAGTHVHIHMHLDDGHHGKHPDVHADPHGHHSENHEGHHRHLHYPSKEEYMYARCEIVMNPIMMNTPHNIQGSIFFRQKLYQPLEIILHLAGFSVPAGHHDHSGHADHMGHSHHTDHSGHAGHVHGFHVHQFGDFSNGCNSFGSHYNPDNVDHSSHGNDVRHAGDWGNIECDMKGEVHNEMNDTRTSLIGVHSIIGRGIVIHENQDDMGLGGNAGSLATGNAGARLACCTVAWSEDLDWAKLLEHHDHDHK